MRRALPLVIVGFAGAAGCGDDGGNGRCADIDPEPLDALLGSPIAIPSPACEAGGMAGFDPSGLWYVAPSGELGGFGARTVKFAVDCESGLTALANSTQSDYVSFSDDALFWRQEFSSSQNATRYIEATSACRVNADGTVTGYFASCVVVMGQAGCEPPAEVTLSRFGRLPGESEGDGLELVSEFAGSADDRWEGYSTNVRVHGEIAYVTRARDGLRIVDLSDPAAPAEVGHHPVADGEDYNDVKIVTGPGNTTYALCASNASGVDVIDVTDPTDPRKVAFFSPHGDPNNGVHTLFTETVGDQTRAYLADGGSAFMAIFDVTDPANPLSLGGYTAPDMEWGFHDLFVSGGRAYINATWGGLLVVDTLDDPANPTQLGQFLPEDDPYLYSHSNWVTTAGGRTISLHGDEGYSAHLEVIDVDPASDEFMEMIGELQLRPETSIHNIMAFGDKGYAAHYQDGVRVFDLSDPTRPRLAAYFNTWDPETAVGGLFDGAIGIDVDPAAGVIYVADMWRGLLVLTETD